MVDVESDGPIPGDYSMISFGAVLVTPMIDKTFYGKLRPISDKWIPEAMAVSGFSREEVLKFEQPEKVMADFRDWLKVNVSGRPMFISDNNGYDWQFTPLISSPSQRCLNSVARSPGRTVIRYGNNGPGLGNSARTLAASSPK